MAGPACRQRARARRLRGGSPPTGLSPMSRTKTQPPCRVFPQTKDACPEQVVRRQNPHRRFQAGHQNLRTPANLEPTRCGRHPTTPEYCAASASSFRSRHGSEGPDFRYRLKTQAPRSAKPYRPIRKGCDGSKLWRQARCRPNQSESQSHPIRPHLSPLSPLTGNHATGGQQQLCMLKYVVLHSVSWPRYGHRQSF